MKVKRMLAFLLMAVFCFGLLTACKNNGASPTDSSGSPSDSVSDSGSSTGSGTNTENTAPVVWDDELEHKIIVSDITLHGIVVLDLNVCSGDWDKLTSDPVVVWEWKAENSKGCTIGATRVGQGIDEAKYRYSEYYGKDVIIAASSGGWAGVIDYETGDTLWEAALSNCPHSIEMLPNGDVVVAGSGGSKASEGSLVYYPLSAGKTTKSNELKINSCHGVCWDPEEEVLWTVGADGVYCVKPSNMGKENAKLTLVSGSEAKFKNDSWGHDLSPVFGSPTKYWVTAGEVWQFDTETLKLTQGYTNKSNLNASSVKGIAYFEDGTMVQTVANKGNVKTTYDWSTRQLRVLVRTMTTGKVPTPKYTSYEIEFPDREFYKVHTFTKDYK